MAMQPIDRQRAKHGKTTAKRAVPQLVNRTNKRVLPELVAQHVLASRFPSAWLRGNLCDYWY